MLLELHGVSKRFEKKQIIASATLSVGAGEILCLTGPSGIGKTTLLEIMAGVVSPDGGTVERHVKPALMFQDKALIPWLTAEANITYILPADMTRKEMTETAEMWLAFFGLEKTQYPSAMSGGMRRRLSLARTFASGRPLLLLDEPFAFLDDAWQKKIAVQISSSIRKGAAVILTSHTVAFLEFSYFERIPYRIVSITESPFVINCGIFNLDGKRKIQ